MHWRFGSCFTFRTIFTLRLSPFLLPDSDVSAVPPLAPQPLPRQERWLLLLACAAPTSVRDVRSGLCARRKKLLSFLSI